MHNYLNFITKVPDSNTILIGHYNPLLVAVSILIAILKLCIYKRVSKSHGATDFSTSWLY